jgi:hypothetical protein
MHTLARLLALVLWLSTFLLIIPARVHFPTAASVAGAVLVMSAPMAWLGRPELNFVAEYSLWIGMMIMLLASGLFVWQSGGTPRMLRIVAIADFMVVIASITIGILADLLYDVI